MSNSAFFFPCCLLQNDSKAQSRMVTGEKTVFQLWNNYQFIGFQPGTFKQTEKRLKCTSGTEYDSLFDWWKPVKVVLNLEFDQLCNVSAIRQQAENKLQPVRENRCTVMFLSNLAYPDWISVPCDEPLLSIIFCSNETEAFQESLHEIVTPICPLDYILFRGECVKVVVFPTCKTDLSAGIETVSLTRKNVKTFEPLLLFYEDERDTAKRFVSIDSTVNTCTVIRRKFAQFKEIEWGVQPASCDHTSGLSFLTVAPVQYVLEKHKNGHVWFCNSGEIISSELVCDGRVDCQGQSDETQCDCVTSNRSECLVLCKTSNCSWTDSNNMTFLNQKTTPLFVECKGGGLILESNINDGFPDCPDGGDEQEFKYSIKENIMDMGLCEDQSMKQCYEGFNRCFPLSKRCLHEVDEYHNSVTCRNGHHLSDCKDFQCNIAYKCPDSFCIPHEYLCNGLWECPSGKDENSCVNITCVGMFQCRQSTSCLHTKQVCDGTTHCRHGDDEYLCELKEYTCPGSCNCFKLIIACSKMERSITNIINLSPFISIHIMNSKIAFPMMLEFPNFRTVFLTSSSVTAFCQEDFAEHVQLSSLLVSKILLNRIQESCLQSFPLLVDLKLSVCHIKHVAKNSFQELTKLRILNLSGNQITKLMQNQFFGLISLCVLNLRRNPLTDLQPSLFVFLTRVVFIDTDYFAVCCATVRQITCSAEMQWPMTCSGILGTTGMRYALFLAVLLIFALNSCSSVFYVHKRVFYKLQL